MSAHQANAAILKELSGWMLCTFKYTGPVMIFALWAGFSLESAIPGIIWTIGFIYNLPFRVGNDHVKKYIAVCIDYSGFE